MPAAALIFWGSLLLLFYTFAGYPLVLRILNRLRSRSATRRRDGEPSASAPFQPPVTVVICVHNEADRIAGRIKNLLQSDYPGRLGILVVSDGSSDRTVQEVQACMHPGSDRQVVLLNLPRREGKPQGLNRALEQVRDEIVVFSDARQSFEPGTIRLLVKRFANPRVGAVSGALEIQQSASTTGAGVDAYWRLEKFLRHQESLMGTTIGCTGAVYAIRRPLYRPMPPDTILDDVLVPMQILTQGYEIVFEPTAVAWDPQSLEPALERVRKRRTLAGNYQLLIRHPGWLLPGKNRAWWQLISHKHLRLAAPWILLVTLAANLALLPRPVYSVALLGQCLLYLLAVWGLCFSRLRLKVLSIPAGFVFLNAMAVAGLIHYLRGGSAVWERSPGGNSDAPEDAGGKPVS